MDFKNNFDRLKTVLGKHSGQSDNAKGQPLSPQVPEFLVEAFSAEEASMVEENDHLRALLLKLGNIFWRNGWDDGKINQNKIQINDIANANAVFLQDEIKSAYEGRLSQLKTENKLKEKIYRNAEANYEASDKYHKSLTEQYRKNPRKFSQGVALVYLAIAVLLTFADMPLTLKLTRTGFDLDGGENLRIQQLIENPGNFFKENWEILILAMGIAMCAIVIKIFYDEFIEKPLEHTIKEFKNLESEVTPKELQQIKRKHWVQLAFKACMVLLTLTTMVMLGKFRFETIEYQKRLEAVQSSPDSSMAGIEESRQKITQWTFISLTILFPLIGGICASLGLNYWDNVRSLKRARKDCETSRTIFLYASKELETAHKKRSNWMSVLDWGQSDDFVDSIQKFLLNQYDHGYQRGLLESELNMIIEYDVFISFSSIDKEQATEIYDAIVSAGGKAFLSAKSLSAGDDFAEEIKKRLVASRELWLLVSPNSLKSEWVLTEWGAAWALNKKIVPILYRCRPEELPDRLRIKQSIDFHQYPDLIKSVF